MNLPRLIHLTVVFLFFTSIAVAQEKLPANAKIVKLESTPDGFQLANPFDYRQLRIDATLENGDVLDVTRIATIKPSGSFVKISPTGLVRPVADGKGELSVSVGDQSIDVPVFVGGQKTAYPVSFVRDVMPVISKVGCNAGTCHGSAEGKNGFKLSLRGYDPLFDHRALTDDLEGRRFNRAAPERSLMLLKTSGAVPHVGGVICQPGDPYYELLKAWIAQGVKLDLNTPRVASLDVLPKNHVIPSIGQKQQMAVMATYTDGSVRDVTAEAFLESSNTEVATVDKAGLVSTVRRGETTMLARFEGNYAASTLYVMGDRSGFEWNNPEAFNHLDELVYDKLKRVKVLPSDLCTDADFIRRITIDLIGLPPEPEQVRAFLADTRPTRVKRDELIDKLVGSDPYIEHWTNKWSDLLQVNRKFLGDVGAKSLRNYIRNALATNMPYDKFAYSVLTATGSNAENGPAAYYKVLRTPDTAMENTTQLFLAIRFNCNKCHDHPFERWTQDQYYSLASYFAQISRTRDPKYAGNIGGSNVDQAAPLVEIIADTNSGDVTQIRTGATAVPKFPFVHTDMPATNQPRRTQLAKWVTSKDNPYFAKSYVNRVWSYLLGVGIIEPIDDIRAGNPPTNPALLDSLTSDFIDSDFNVQKLIKTICKSRTYQLAIKTNKWNEGDDINYSHALARRLPAEVLFDAIYAVTGSTSKIPGLPAGGRAAQVLDGSVELPSGFLELFGKPVRESACECERSSGLMLGPVLNLINGPIVADAIKDSNNRIARLAVAEKDDARFVEEIYLATLSRLPSPEELKLGLRALQDSKGDYQAAAADFEKREKALRDYEKQVDAKEPAWEKELAAAPQWELLSPDPKGVFAKNRKATTITVESDKSLFVTGANASPEIYTIEATTNLKHITAIRLEALADQRLPSNGPGRAPNGNFVLNEFKLTAELPGAPAKAVALHKAQATFSQDSFPVAGAVDGNPTTGWAISPQLGKSHMAIFEFKEPISSMTLTGTGTHTYTGATKIASGTLALGSGAALSNTAAKSDAGIKLTIVLDQRFSGKDHNIGKFRLAVTGDAKPRLANAVPPELAPILASPADKRTRLQKGILMLAHRYEDAEYLRLTEALENAPLPADPRILGGQDLMWALINNPAFLFNH